jgi:hypothetical protein
MTIKRFIQNSPGYLFDDINDNYLLNKIDNHYLTAVPSDYQNDRNSEYEMLIINVVILHAMNQKVLQVFEQAAIQPNERLNIYDNIITELYDCIRSIIVNNNRTTNWFLPKFETLESIINRKNQQGVAVYGYGITGYC